MILVYVVSVALVESEATIKYACVGDACSEPVNRNGAVVLTKLLPLRPEVGKELLDIVASENCLDSEPVIDLILLN
jgi:hypothetical protein